MADTLTIRLEDRDREFLEAAARQRDTGLSAFVRSLAETEARRLRDAAIRGEGERVLAYLSGRPEAQSEIDGYGTPRRLAVKRQLAGSIVLVDWRLGAVPANLRRSGRRSSLSTTSFFTMPIRTYLWSRLHAMKGLPTDIFRAH